MIARAERYQVDWPVRLTHEGDFTGEGRLINISITGCALRTNTRMEEGTLLTLQVQPALTAPPIQIDMARIRWVNNDEFGIEFLVVYQKARKDLLRWLKTVAVQFIP